MTPPRFLTSATTLVSLFFATSSFAKPDVDAALHRWFKAGQPGGAVVAYITPDGVTYAALGEFSPHDQRPLDADTRFEIGSVTKVFTAILLADSERAGKVQRTDPAAKYLLPASDPDQAKLAKITLLSLTTHTSGLPRMPGNIPEAAGPHPYARYDRARLVAALRTLGPQAEVGHAAAYSNFGVSVLGEALAAAWEQPYADVLRTRVFEPLGLKATSLNMTGAKEPENFAPGFSGDRAVPHWTFQAMAPAGALISSARELAGFVEICLGLRETPLREALTETFQPQPRASASSMQTGLGWIIEGEPKQPVLWHNGGTGGFRSFVGFCPAMRCGVVVLTSNSANDPTPFGKELLGAKPRR